MSKKLLIASLFTSVLAVPAVALAASDASHATQDKAKHEQQASQGKAAEQHKQEKPKAGAEQEKAAKTNAGQAKTQ